MHLIEIAIAMQDNIAPRGERCRGAFSGGADESTHTEIVGDQKAVKTDHTTNDPADDFCRRGGWGIRIDGGIDDVRRHRQRHIGESGKPAQVARQSSATVAASAPNARSPMIS